MTSNVTSQNSVIASFFLLQAATLEVQRLKSEAAKSAAAKLERLSPAEIEVEVRKHKVTLDQRVLGDGVDP